MYILLALFLQSFLEPSCQVDKIMEDDQFFSPLSLSLSSLLHPPTDPWRWDAAFPSPLPCPHSPRDHDI